MQQGKGLNMVPMNPTEEQMQWLLDSKAHELLGNLCPVNKSVKEQWKEISNTNGIKISKREIKMESVHIMRGDMTVKCSTDVMCKTCMSQEQFSKMMAEVESITKVSSTNDSNVSLIKCKKTKDMSMPVEALVLCGCKTIGDHSLVVRTSVETDKAPKTPQGTTRICIGLSGSLVTPSSTKPGHCDVSVMCSSDMIDSMTPEQKMNIPSILQERMEKLKEWCEKQ